METIKVPEITNRAVQVKQTNKIMRATFDLQLQMAKIDDADTRPVVEQIGLLSTTTEAVFDYLTLVLKLTKKEQAHLDELEMEETVHIAQYVMARLLGVSDEQVAESESDQKSAN
ncbi:phage tail tube assembly chaperone [Lacticaseibacillus pantheris]|uniref:phage tail tube assembly chaperone n=1 Tax=Lacticaseibacillus pantheris TaxID=171523 RepID=UPI00265B03C0|nr:phage tail tube assembly chaperone [Lacticaseibacillus pantheris]WKF86025.1 phage tail tube assembly chaperone [Lacticaseibacillus pantheris]